MDGRVEHTYGVSELAGELSRLLVTAFPAEVWARGQIRNLSRARSGHVYFDLAEPCPLGDRPEAFIPVTLFSDDKVQVNRALMAAGGGVRMDDGAEIRLRGRVTWYPAGGRLQLRMSTIDPAYTLGRLAEDRDRLLAALSAEGLLDRAGALPLAPVPLRVGLVTSRGSAAEADFLQELAASGMGWRVTAVDARTQGVAAEPSLLAALSRLAAVPTDVIALVRGGGARTDLAAFDREALARAIATCPVPVVTGIGHEVDSTVADRVAHRSCKTPTACAAALVEQAHGFVIDVEGSWAAVASRAHRRLAETDRELADTAHHVARATRVGLASEIAFTAEAVRRVERSATHRLRRRATEAERSGQRAAAAAGRRLVSAEAQLSASAHQLPAAGRRQLDAAGHRLATAEATVRGADPTRAFARGWSVTRRPGGALVRSPADVTPGETLLTTVADGTIASRVAESDPPGPHPGGSSRPAVPPGASSPETGAPHD